MDITEYTTKPKLVEVILDTPELRERYGDSIKFYTFDAVKLTTYFGFFESRVSGDFERLENIMRTLILNKEGKEAIPEGETLPADIYTQAILEIGELLGKSLNRTST